MGLTEYQGALARLYTDAALRERFLADPTAVGPELGLTGEETALAAGVPASQVRLFAASLVGKRGQEVAKLLPLTRRALGERYRGLFSLHARHPIGDDIHKHLTDAVAFAAALQTADGVEAWVRDLARYESAGLEASASKKWGLLRVFHYPVGHLARLLRDNQPVADVTARRTLGLWLRPRHGRVRHRLFPRSP